MRIFLVSIFTASLFARTAGAQGPTKSGEALEKFKQQVEALAKAGRLTPPSGVNPPPKICSIPLLVVGPKDSVDRSMAITPRGDVHYHMVEVIPPAPVCGAGNIIWK